MALWVDLGVGGGGGIAGIAAGWVTFGKPAISRHEKRLKRRDDAWKFIEQGAPVRLETLERDAAEIKANQNKLADGIVELRIGQKIALGAVDDLRNEIADFRKEQTENGKNTRNQGDLIALIADAVLPKEVLANLKPRGTKKPTN